MHRAVPTLLGLLLLAPLAAQAQGFAELHANYDMYAAGFNVVQLDVGFDTAPHTYRMQVAFRTTGLVGVFMHGHQRSTVDGSWDEGWPYPRQYEGTGVWHGEDRVTRIDYRNGQPLVRQLLPTEADEREPVPVALQGNTMDSLSALALLIRRVADTGRCEATARTFDGHRLSEIKAYTAGDEMLAPNERSSFSGKALRCDFVGQMLAGFRREDNSPNDRRPLHGSAWFATMLPDNPPVPVKIAVETHWFGDATLYLTHLQPQSATVIAAH